jgi:hypothetical protein
VELDKPYKIPRWIEAIPSGAWAVQEGGDSVGASNTNSLIAQRYREWYQELLKRDIPEEWIPKIFSIAFDFNMDYIEVAEEMRLYRKIHQNKGTDFGEVRTPSEYKSSTRTQKMVYQLKGQLKEVLEKLPTKLSSDTPRKKFSKRIEETFRLARIQRQKDKKKR